MSISVRKIAAAAHVSPATVSRVLNDYPYVKLEVRKHVIETALALGYSPRKNIVWVILPSDSNFTSYLGFMLSALWNEALQRNIHLMIVSEQDIQVLGGLHLCDGVISLPYHLGLEKRWGAEEALPMVCINSDGRPGDNILRVSSNNRQGIFLALDHLKQKGHRKIVFLNMVMRQSHDSTDVRERQMYYTEWMRENLPEAEPEIIYADETDTLLKQIRDQRITAVFVAGEAGTAEFFRIAQQQNIRIPEDLSVIGMECNWFRILPNSVMTTIGQDWQAIASTAFDLLEKLIDKQSAADQFIDFLFYERASVLSIEE